MINELRDIYNSWNNSNLKLLDKGNFIEITTPFVDIHHDFLQLVLIKNDNGSFTLSDDGYTLNELEILGIDLKKSGKRKAFLTTTISLFGIQINSLTNELLVNFNRLEDYPSKQLNLLQGILRISDMLMTSRNSIMNIFFEEISELFASRQIINTPNVSFPGKTGNDYKFDFVIPQFNNKPEKIIKAVNNPTSDNYKYPLLAFIEIRDYRPDSTQAIFVNDSNKNVPGKFTTAFESYDIKVYKWSEKEIWLDEINPLIAL